MSIETAVIAAGGAGTRTFPVTTSQEQCMLPIYAGKESRSVIDFIVEECALAGIKRVIFVTSERGEVQLSEYFEGMNEKLKGQLERLGRVAEIERELERRRALRLEFEYVIQPPNQYGTALPPYLAMPHLTGEPRFALVTGDDFVYRQDGASELTVAMKHFDDPSVDHVIMGNPVAREEAPRYGILDTDSQGNLRSIDEKPPKDKVPAKPVANISRYLLSDSIWPYIEEEMARNRGKEEHWVTHPINAALDQGQVFRVHPVEGKYMDGGSFEGLEEAGRYIKKHPRSF